MNKEHRVLRGGGILLALYRAFARYGSFIAPLILRARLKRGKEDPNRVAEKQGFASMPRPFAARPEGKLIWLHAVGVGEVLALPALIAELEKHAPNACFLITTSVLNAAQAWEKNQPQSHRCIHQFLPLDFHRYNRRFLDHWRPDISIWAERDIWPDMIMTLKERRIPMVIVNGRMDVKSYRAKSRARGLFSACYQAFDWIDAQDSGSAARFGDFGVESSRLFCSGSLKSSGLPLATMPKEEKAWRKSLGKRRVWLGASTHQGEETVLFVAHKKLLKTNKDAVLFIAPRQPKRAEEICKQAKELGFSTSLIRDGKPPPESSRQPCQIYIETEIGQMGLWYRLASFAFIGGSLAEVGGHNPYEAARLDCAIMHGPNVANFAEDYSALHEAKDKAKAAVLVKDAEGIVQTLIKEDSETLVKNAKSQAERGQKNLTHLAKRICKLF